MHFFIFFFRFDYQKKTYLLINEYQSWKMTKDQSGKPA
ncbi:hypothetical protein NC99_25200 [Sunxiuqinia dokdonensis]|uniref:Uncharacterized protein n=1 Tax=Sunxiuqinia dokdonensis TaxID=1409788 RepID=A0A0L8V937_9BACT|nr:hypothetical protein NC99_25200 [Sunxiuqinia dokdonensis]